MSEPYAYQSQQDSLLKPYYQKWLWGRILAALPDTLAPNTMTAIATLCCGASFLIAVFLNHNPLALLVAAFLIIAYLTLDNLDGAQARKHGKSTRLGEFLDHWLDTLNNGFVVLGACVAAGLTQGFTLAVLLCGTLAFFAVQWELRSTGVFRMGRIADIEGNTAVALLYVSLAIFGQQTFQLQLVPGLPTAATLLGCGVIAQSLWTVLSAFRRIEERRAGFLPLLTASALLGLWALVAEPGSASFLTAAFFLNPAFTSGPIRERLQLARSTPALDWSVVAAIAASAAWSATGALGAISVVVAGLAALTLFYFVASLTKLRHQAAFQKPSRSRV